MSQRYRLVLQYCGDKYFGFQKQNTDVKTIQGTLEVIKKNSKILTKKRKFFLK